MKTVRPADLGDALSLLGERSADAPLVPLAGGTDLLVHWPVREEARDREYLDLTALDELRGVRWSDEALELGALASYWDVIVDRRVKEELPILVASARQVGAIQIQSRGTWAETSSTDRPPRTACPCSWHATPSWCSARATGRETSRSIAITPDTERARGGTTSSSRRFGFRA